MAEILASIRYNLACLIRFSGRDPRGRFWPYAIFIYALSVVAGILLFIPVLFDMFVRMQRFLVEHPEGLPATAGPYDPAAPALPPELMPDLSVVLVPMTLVGVLAMLLLAAAIVRRLHDRDRSGWWALLPVPSIIAGQLMAPRAAAMLGGTPPDPGVMLPVLLNNLVYWITFIALIVMLARAGTEGGNRYGPDPLVAA